MSNDNINEIIDNEDVNAQESEKLDNPLVVHKKSDASYDESSATVEMNDTHSEEDYPTLRRHRFRKEKKSHRGLIAVLIIIVILAGAFSALYVTGSIKFLNETTTAKKTTTTEAVTKLEDVYKGTIVVKGTYIFVDAVEVKGIEGLQKALEYEDKSTTAYTIIDEGANSDFLNFEVLQLLEQMGFYGKDTVITHKESTGLIAEAETTTLPPETTTKKKAAKKKSNTTSKNSSTSNQE
ncbi:MAG: hypothetical protein IJR70_01485 [Eubacterium sp.]|nr:hypothetical protein [Eubacterium sp.]